jgi:HD-like signal output (HDOD) protein
MMLTPRRLAETVSNVPSLPAIFTRLSVAIEDPRSSIRDIESVVREDAALAGRLLRLANSAYFGFPARVDTLSRAITLVGSRQLRDLAIATSVIDTFRGVSPAHVTMESFWRHSIGSGLVARILSSWRREPNSEQYFVAGLLHDIGRLILFLKLGNDMSAVLEVAKSSGKMLFQCEQEHLGFDHAAVGGELLKRWNLPPHICSAVEFHHIPQRAGSHKQAAAMVHVADILINGIACGGSGERYVPPLDSEAWQLLELSPSIVGPTLKLLEQQLADTLSTLLDDAS